MSGAQRWPTTGTEPWDTGERETAVFIGHHVARPGLSTVIKPSPAQPPPSGEAEGRAWQRLFANVLCETLLHPPLH